MGDSPSAPRACLRVPPEPIMHTIVEEPAAADCAESPLARCKLRRAGSDFGVPAGKGLPALTEAPMRLRRRSSASGKLAIGAGGGGADGAASVDSSRRLSTKSLRSQTSMRWSWASQNSESGGGDDEAGAIGGLGGLPGDVAAALPYVGRVGGGDFESEERRESGGVDLESALCRTRFAAALKVALTVEADHARAVAKLEVSEPQRDVGMRNLGPVGRAVIQAWRETADFSIPPPVDSTLAAVAVQAV